MGGSRLIHREIAAFVLTIAGALTPASAVGSWMYINDVGQPCLTSSTASNNIWVQCNCQAIGVTLWRWGSETNQWNGHAMRRLVSNAGGACLATDRGAETNDVCAAPCGNGRTGQFWTADNDSMQNRNGTWLRTSPSRDGLRGGCPGRCIPVAGGRTPSSAYVTARCSAEKRRSSA